MSQAGVHEHLADVAQAHALAVEVIFTLTAAVIFARDHDLRRIHRELSGRIVQNQRDLCCSHRTAPRRTGKDNILHLCAAQALGGLLAQHPADGVRNIRFSASVRPDNCSHAVRKPDGCPVRERFKPL